MNWLAIGGTALAGFLVFYFMLPSSGRAFHRQKSNQAAWSNTFGCDPSIYGQFCLPFDPIKKYVDKLNANRGADEPKVSVAHVFGKAIAVGLQACPWLNSTYSGWGKWVTHETCDISYLIAVAGGKGLSMVSARECEKKTVKDIAAEYRAHLDKVAQKKDEATKTMVSLSKLLPMFLLRFMLYLSTYVGSILQIPVPALGIRKRPFGSVLVTNMGPRNVTSEVVFAPNTPWTRVSTVLLMHAPYMKAVVDEETGEVVARRVIEVSITADHRLCDGWLLTDATEAFKAFCMDPEAFDRDDVTVAEVKQLLDSSRKGGLARSVKALESYA